MPRMLNGKSRFEIQRRLGIELPGLGKPGALERRPYPPGQHGQRRRKQSDYAVHLLEKQKVLFHYGLREKQLRNYVAKAKKDRSKAWIDTLVINLERRLDNALLRLNFAPSMASARQLVLHGHVLVNGKKIRVPMYSLNVGDVITLSVKGYASQTYQFAVQHPTLPSVPASWSIEKKGNTEQEATLKAMPLPEDIPFQFDNQLVTEFYWKI